jgi:uncharacterized RDD family membrane protein YckC
VGWAQGPPPASGRLVPDAPGFVFAGVPVRFAAWVIDGFLIGIVTTLVASAAGPLLGVDVFGGVSPAATPEDLDEYLAFLQGQFTIGYLVIQAVTLAIGWAYFTFSWTSSARGTPGQRILDIQVAHAGDGRTLTRTEASARWLALGYVFSIVGVIPLLPIILLAALAAAVWELVLLGSTLANDRRIGLHDRIAGTWVVQPAGQRHDGLARGCVVIVAVLILLPVALFALLLVGLRAGP